MALVRVWIVAMVVSSTAFACFDEDAAAVHHQMKQMGIEITDCPADSEAPLLAASLYCGSYSGNTKSLRRSLLRTLQHPLGDRETAFLDDRRAREKGFFNAFFTLENQALKLRMDLSSRDLIIQRFSDLPTDLLDAEDHSRSCTESISDPVPISGDLPMTPEDLRVRRVARTDIVIEALLDRNGVIEHAVVLYNSSHISGVQNDVLEVIERWRYTPAQEASGPVPYVKLIYIRFTIG